jgi:hypothetical protein
MSGVKIERIHLLRDFNFHNRLKSVQPSIVRKITGEPHSTCLPLTLSTVSEIYDKEVGAKIMGQTCRNSGRAWS